MTDVKAQGTVTFHYTRGGGQPTDIPDHDELRWVYKDSRGHYYLKFYTRKLYVTRYEGTDRFLLHFDGHGEKTT
jgi:hypothetical protein